MTAPRSTRHVSPRQRRVYAQWVREALAKYPDATLDELVQRSGIPRGIIQVIAARIRRASSPSA